MNYKATNNYFEKDPGVGSISQGLFFIAAKRLDDRDRCLSSHSLKDGFQRHGMHTASARLKELAVAFPGTVYVLYIVSIVIPFDRDSE